MAAKELKAQLKKAKAAIDKQDYQEAKACCKVRVDRPIYMQKLIEQYYRGHLVHYLECL